MFPHFHVVSAVIVKDGGVFCFRKGHSQWAYLSGKYEFPGGKVEPGESQRNALIREIREELSVDITIMDSIIEYDFRYPDFSLSMASYLCQTQNPAFALNEHTEVRLVEVHQLDALDWLPADRPIVEVLPSVIND